MCLNLRGMTLTKILILKIIFTGENDKEYYTNSAIITKSHQVLDN